MQLNGRLVKTFMRVSPTLIVLGLEGDHTYDIRGNKALIDKEEQKWLDAFAVKGKKVGASQITAETSEIEQEGLDLPTYNFQSEEHQRQVYNEADDEGLSLPSYDFRFAK